MFRLRDILFLFISFQLIIPIKVIKMKHIFHQSLFCL